jgi:hypothetical protein
MGVITDLTKHPKHLTRRHSRRPWGYFDERSLLRLMQRGASILVADLRRSPSAIRAKRLELDGYLTAPEALERWELIHRQRRELATYSTLASKRREAVLAVEDPANAMGDGRANAAASLRHSIP